MNRNQPEQGPIARQLSGAEMAMGKCVQKLKHGIYDGGFSNAVGVDFEQVLYHLNLACEFLKTAEEAKAIISPEECRQPRGLTPDFEAETDSLSDAQSLSAIKQSILV